MRPLLAAVTVFATLFVTRWLLHSVLGVRARALPSSDLRLAPPRALR